MNQQAADSSGKQPRGRPFQKGQSGNPGGRFAPRVLTPDGQEVNLRELARAQTYPAFMRLVQALEDDDSRVAVAAAEHILNRGWGKPASVLAGENGEGLAALQIIWQEASSE